MADQHAQDDSTLDLSGLGAGAPAGGNPQAGGAANAGKFDIPQVIQEQYPQLVGLILETESMTDDEREYWFQILPVMTDDQIVKFQEILVNEKQQLAQLDQEYEAELTKLNEKHLVEWKEFETKEKRRALKEAEEASEEEEAQKEEDLLRQLEDL